MVNAEYLQDIRKYYDRLEDFLHREKKYNSSEKIVFVIEISYVFQSQRLIQRFQDLQRN